MSTPPTSTSPETCGGLGGDTPRCGEPTRDDVFHGVWCACERGVPGIDPRA